MVSPTPDSEDAQVDQIDTTFPESDVKSIQTIFKGYNERFMIKIAIAVIVVLSIFSGLSFTMKNSKESLILSTLS